MSFALRPGIHQPRPNSIICECVYSAVYFAAQRKIVQCSKKFSSLKTPGNSS
jgi:hypothetical protein